LFGLTLLLGVFQRRGQPSRLALIPTLVDRPSLPSALAINAIIFTPRFIGPAVAGDCHRQRQRRGGFCG